MHHDIYMHHYCLNIGDLVTRIFNECCQGELQLLHSTIGKEQSRQQTIQKSQGIAGNTGDIMDENSDNEECAPTSIFVDALNNANTNNNNVCYNTAGMETDDGQMDTSDNIASNPVIQNTIEEDGWETVTKRGKRKK